MLTYCYVQFKFHVKWTNVKEPSSLTFFPNAVMPNHNILCIQDTFAGLPLVDYWRCNSNNITVLEAGTFQLKAGANGYSISMRNNDLHSVEPGTFVLPATGNRLHAIQPGSFVLPATGNSLNTIQQGTFVLPATGNSHQTDQPPSCHWLALLEIRPSCVSTSRMYFQSLDHVHQSTNIHSLSNHISLPYAHFL